MLSLKQKIIVGLIVVVIILIILTLYLLYKRWVDSNSINEKFSNMSMNMSMNMNNNYSKERFANSSEPIEYIANVQCIAIYLPSNNDNYINLSGVFIYDDKGNLINLQDPNYGYSFLNRFYIFRKRSL